MREVTGFVTTDGSFFEREKDAKLHEVELRLREKMSREFPGIDQEKFFGIMLEITHELVEFLNAYQAAHADTKGENREEAGGGEKTEADDGLSVQHRPEEDLASLLQFPPGRPEHVPDVGSGARTEKVSDRRKKHGPGSR